MKPNQSEVSLSSGGYSSDPEPRRRKEKHHSERRQSHDKSGRDKSRSTNKDALLGAAGGGLIGDLIFPGLGTVGGALAGWLGGKDYGEHRKYREDKLGREQRSWERKHGHVDEWGYGNDKNDRGRSHDRR